MEPGRRRHHKDLYAERFDPSLKHEESNMAQEREILKAPTAAKVDELAKDYIDLKAKVLESVLATRAANEKLDPVERDLVELVRKFGSVHAEKSKLLHGLHWEIMGTFGTSTSTDAAAVEHLREHLVKTENTRLLKRLFDKTVRWALRSTARAEILKADVPCEVRALFAACEVTKDRSPSITAREKAPA
jgi:hypothetical protein